MRSKNESERVSHVSPFEYEVEVNATRPAQTPQNVYPHETVQTRENVYPHETTNNLPYAYQSNYLHYQNVYRAEQPSNVVERVVVHEPVTTNLPVERTVVHTEVAQPHHVTYTTEVEQPHHMTYTTQARQPEYYTTTTAIEQTPQVGGYNPLLRGMNR